MLSRASPDEDFARSVRRRLTCKRPQPVKEVHLHRFRKFFGHTARKAVHVARTERLILRTVNVKSLKPVDQSRSQTHGDDTNTTIDHIDRDMRLQGSHMVGVQESRVDSKSLWHSRVQQMGEYSLVTRLRFIVLCWRNQESDPNHVLHVLGLQH